MRLRASRFVLSALVAATCWAVAGALVYNVDVPLQAGTKQYHMHRLEGMFSRSDAPAGTDAPLVRANLTLSMGRQALGTRGMPVKVTATFCLRGCQEHGLMASNLQQEFCCTSELKRAGLCDEVGDMLRDEAIPAVEAAVAPGDNHELALSLPVAHTSQTIVLVVACPAPGLANVTSPGGAIMSAGDRALATPDLAPPLPVTVRGQMVFRNPYGYLPGEVFGALPFFAVVTAAFMLLATFYMGKCAQYRSQVISLHRMLLSAIMLGAVEGAATFFMLLDQNVSGTPACCPPSAGAVVVAILAVSKRTVALVCLLAVCIGYGVALPKLERRVSFTLVALGLLYFVVAVPDELDQLHNPSTPSAWALPVFVLDVVFLCWIYCALATTMARLRARGEVAKLKMYGFLCNTLSGMVLLWALFAVLVMLVQNSVLRITWPWYWALHYFWALVYFITVCMLAIFWRPSPTSSQYAYSAQLPTSEAEAAEAAGHTDEGEIELAFGEGTAPGTNAPSALDGTDDADAFFTDTDGDDRADVLGGSPQRAPRAARSPARATAPPSEFQPQGRVFDGITIGSSSDEEEEEEEGAEAKGSVGGAVEVEMTPQGEGRV